MSQFQPPPSAPEQSPYPYPPPGYWPPPPGYAPVPTLVPPRQMRPHMKEAAIGLWIASVGIVLLIGAPVLYVGAALNVAAFVCLCLI